MWNEQQSKRVGPFEVKGKTVQYQEKFLLQLMHPCKIWNVRGNTTTQKYLGVVRVSVSHWHWTTAWTTYTCAGRVTAQGNKDTMTTMVVVIVDDGDHHLDHDETLGGG